MKIIRPPANAIAGFDESKFQTDITWPVVAQTKYFVELKATEGASYTDPMFPIRWKLAEQAGMRRIAYLFGDVGARPADQALHFHNVVMAQGPLSDFDGIMFDWEASGLGLTEGLQIIGECENLFRRKMIIYGSSYYLQALNLPAQYAKNPLHVADYSHAPLIPEPWASHSTVSFWQFTGSGHTQGVNTPVDLDLFYGDREAYDTLMKSLIEPEVPF